MRILETCGFSRRVILSREVLFDIQGIVHFGVMRLMMPHHVHLLTQYSH